MKKFVISAAIFLTILVTGGVAVWYFEFYQVKINPVQLYRGTSINPVLGNQTSLYEVIKENYPDLYPRLVTNHSPKSYNIPGLIKARNIHAKGQKEWEIGTATDMTPQGLAVMENYIVISAYSKSKAFYSVLWLLEKKTGKFVKTIVLDNTDHVGGLAYDPQHKRLWITSVAEDWSNATISYLSYQDIQKYSLEKSEENIEYEDFYVLEGLHRTSFMAYHQNRLYVGHFNKKSDGRLGYYALGADGLPLENSKKYFADSKAVELVKIPDRIQGLAIKGDKIYLSQSYGSGDANLLVFEYPKSGKLEDMTYENMIQNIDTPAYMEQIATDGDYLYALFEGAATAYRNNGATIPVDQILKLQFKKDKK